MLYPYYGDILDIRQGIICHQVNCMGKMGAGIALAIRKKWPQVYQDYMAAYRNKQLMLGTIIVSDIVPDQLRVVSLCGQYYYGRKGLYTNYQALEICFEEVEQISKECGLPVYIPYMMGCSLAGGDWETVYNIISSKLTYASIVIKQENTLK